MFHVVEGFYGRPWSLDERLDMIQFLADNGFSGYCYAPKADKKLRQDCHVPYKDKELADLQVLADACVERGQDFSVGLSPDQFLRTPSDPGLQYKIKQLKSLESCSLGIFFDDVKNTESALAQRQIAFVSEISTVWGARIRLFCPTYYSSDPILGELFGDMPNHYLEDLGEGLSSDVQILWTGERVVSDHYQAKHLQSLQPILKRKPTLWDNAFVNDGRKTSPYLPLGKIANYPDITSVVRSIFINPMNQAALAKVNLSMAIHDESLQAALQRLAPDFAQTIVDHIDVFTEQGLDKMTSETHQQLHKLFSTRDHPIAKNITDWLNGDYRFDPACLT